MKTGYQRDELISIRKKLKAENKKVVFTNGCFDLLHAGHVDYLAKAKALGDVLIVGLNTDNSIKRIKGDKRPITPETERALVISNLKAVDYVTLFDEDTPHELSGALAPEAADVVWWFSCSGTRQANPRLAKWHLNSPSSLLHGEV